MRILLCPPPAALAGSQQDALDLASGVKDHGHRVSVFAPSGPAFEQARVSGLDVITAPDPRRGKEWVRMLGTVVERDGVDLVHAYEWQPCLDAAFRTGVLRRTPVLVSVLSMSAPRLPRGLPIVVSTPALAARQRETGRTAYVIEPSVDMIANQSSDVPAARARWNIGADEIVVSTVSMLSTEREKLQGVLSLMAVVDRLSAGFRIRLLIAGEGEGFEQVCRRAYRINERRGREIVQPLGFQADPGQVYDAADVTIGMGTSAISAMAYGKPLIVQGAAGFWQTVRPETAEQFLYRGWFGVGGAGDRDLEAAIRPLLDDVDQRAALGRFGRDLVGYRYSLTRAARRLAGLYAEVGTDPLRVQRMSRSVHRTVGERVPTRVLPIGADPSTG